MTVYATSQDWNIRVTTGRLSDGTVELREGQVVDPLRATWGHSQTIDRAPNIGNWTLCLYCRLIEPTLININHTSWVLFNWRSLGAYLQTVVVTLLCALTIRAFNRENWCFSIGVLPLHEHSQGPCDPRLCTQLILGNRIPVLNFKSPLLIACAY